MNPEDFDQYPQGYARVRAALLAQGVGWETAVPITDAWRASRLSDTQALRLVCGGVLSPGQIEAHKDRERAAGREVHPCL